MTLSSQVKESLLEAEGNLRNALSWSSKNERPITSREIADLIYRIDALIKMDQFTDKLEELQDQIKKKGGGGDIFGGLY